MADIDKLSIEKLDVDNYATWRVKMKWLLITKGYWDAVASTAAAPVNTEMDQKALALIGLCVRDHHLSTLSACTTARQAWEHLERVYNAQSNARRLRLRRELTSLKLGVGEPLTKFFARAKAIRDQLNAGGHAVTDEEVATSVLEGLPSEYDTIVTFLTTTNEALDLDIILAKLLTVEQRIGKPEGDTMAFLSHKPGVVRKQPASSRKCWYCGISGHVIADCRKKRYDDSHAGSSSNAFGPGSYGSNDNRGNRHAMQGSSYVKKRSPTHHGAALSAWSEGVQEWVLDSGASHHVTNDIKNLTRIKDQDLARATTIKFGNNTMESAAAVGDVELDTYIASLGFWQRIILQDVLFVPTASDNMLSVRRATKNGAQLAFSGDSCLIKLRGEVIAEASGSSGIYHIYAVPCECEGGADAAVMATSSTVSPQLWHRRFGHLGYDNLVRLARDNMVRGMNIPASAFKEASERTCEPCVMAKQHRLPFGASVMQCTQPMELVHMDLCGPMPVESLGGSRYIATFLDDYSKFSVVRPIKNKSDVTSIAVEVLTYLENQSGYKLKAIRTDNGREYVNKDMSSFLKSKGVAHQTTMPYTPEQNGKAERLNRTIMERIRAILTDSQLPDELWAEAAVTANFIKVRSPVSGFDKTPWELFYGSKPDVSMMRAFGTKVYVHVPREKRHKLQSVSVRGIMVGYQPHSKGYRILLDDMTIITSRDVIFDEDVTESVTVSGSEPKATHLDEPEYHEPETDASTSQDPGDVHPGDESDAEMGDAGVRPHRARQPPGEWWKAQKKARVMVASVQEPATREEALQSENAQDWIQAMDDEMASLHANSTWQLEQLPDGVKSIPCKWVFKVKHDAQGNIERFKARLVAKGYKQQAGVDFDEVYAPTSKYATLRALLALAAAEDMEIHQLDIKTAFLNGELEETVYMQQPPGYEEGEPGTYCHLQRALYGLRQAPRSWHIRLSKELKSLGFEVSEADPGLYIRSRSGGLSFLLVWVDDILIVAPNLLMVQEIKDQVTSAFDARDLGEAAYFLGITITRDRPNHEIKISKERMTLDLVQQFGVAEAKMRHTPLSTGMQLSQDSGEELDMERYPYGSLIGGMLYLSVCTRPDIAHAVGVLSKYMAKPRTTHWNAAKGVLRYLKGTSSSGIIFRGSNTSLIGYCDADYAGDIDTRRSTTGYVFKMNGGAISWSSRRQPTVAVSTTEAEYMGAAHAVKEALWWRKLLNDMSLNPGTVMIMADNQSSIKLLKNPVSSVRSKHIDVIYKFARERVARKEVQFEYVPTEDMIADIMTKALPEKKHVQCCMDMGMM